MEFALVLPLLLLLLLGIIEFGRIFNAYLIVTSASREGARYGAAGASDSEIVAKVKDAVMILDEDKVTVTITPSQSYRVRGTEIKVTVEYPVPLYDPIVSQLVGNPVVVRGETVMRVE
ncbi:MAG: hypothetical protein PWQ91_690 [Eubacteriales bacterium]|nr:hypothetical protein [Eubacteriales bacterium]MDN5363629.1 hypothetical protein [Eubacteriales bacterium]